MKKSIFKKLGAVVTTAIVMCSVAGVCIAGGPQTDGLEHVGSMNPGNCCSYEAGQKYSVTTRQTSAWDKHSIVEFTVKNTGKATIKNWRLTFQVPYQVESMWCASVLEHDADGTYTIKYEDWNKDLYPGASVTFGIIFVSDTQRTLNVAPQWYFMNTRSNGSVLFTLDMDVNLNGRADYYDLIVDCGYKGEVPEAAGATIEDSVTLSATPVAKDINTNRIDMGIYVDTTSLKIDRPNTIGQVALFDANDQFVAELYDDGNAAHGDKVANDGIYSSNEMPGWGTFHAVVTVRGYEYVSNEIEIVCPDDSFLMNDYEAFNNFAYVLGEVRDLYADLHESGLSNAQQYNQYMNLLNRLANGPIGSAYTSAIVDVDNVIYDGGSQICFAIFGGNLWLSINF